jgi:signal transduction histidine kinase
LAGALGLALVALIAIILGASALSQVEREHTTNRAQILARAMVARLTDTPAALRSTLLSRTTARAGLTVSVLDRDGAPLTGTTVFARIPRWMLRGQATVAELDASDRHLLVAVEPVTLDGHAYSVLVAVPFVRTAAGAISIELATLLLVLGALGLVAAVVVARDFADDLRAISRRAKRMSAATAPVITPLPVHGLDEVGALVRAFNELQSQIENEINAHRVALERLEDAERRKEVQIATLRHELRTPLNSIIGFAELLLSGVDGELTPTQTEDVDAIARSGHHLMHLVDDVLDLSAIATGRFSVEKSAVDLATLVQEVVREMTGQARLKRVTLRCESSKTTVIEADPTSLRRAITNLVQNAIQHCKSTVTVELETNDRFAKVRVRDDGKGISPHELKRLFKPFEGGREGGTGLGLAITVALMELHDGTLGAESTVGLGSTFTATIPLHPTALTQAGFG